MPTKHQSKTPVFQVEFCMSLPLGSPVSGLATKIFFDASITEISAIFLFICVIPKLHDEYNVYQT